MKFSPPQLRGEDFPDLEGDRLLRLLRALNGVIGQVGSALNRGLTVAENLAAQVREVTVRDLDPAKPLTVDVDLPGRRRPGLVLVGRCEDVTDVPTTTPTPASCGAPAWSATTTKSGHAIALHAVSGLTAGRTYRLKLLVLPE